MRWWWEQCPCPFVMGGVGCLTVSLHHWWCGQFPCVTLSPVPFSSVQDGIYELGKAHMRSTLPRGSSPTLPLKQFDSSDPFDWVSFVTGGADNLVVSLCHRWCRQFGYDPLSQVVQFGYVPLSQVVPFSYVPLSQVVQFGYVPLSQVVQMVWLCPFVTGGADSLVMSLCHRWCRQIGYVPLSHVVQTVWLCPFVTGGADSLVMSLCHRCCGQFGYVPLS